MTNPNPFGAPIVPNSNGDGEEGPRLQVRNVADHPGIFFVDWRIENWPTKHTLPGEQAEVLGVTWVSLDQFQTTVWDDNQKCDLGVTVNYGQVVRFQIRQRYLIGALKPRLGGDPALGKVRLEWPNGRNSNPHYFYDDLQGDPEVLRRGIEWMTTGAASRPVYDKPSYTPPPEGAPPVQQQQQGQWGGYQGPPNGWAPQPPQPAYQPQHQQMHQPYQPPYQPQPQWGPPQPQYQQAPPPQQPQWGPQPGYQQQPQYQQAPPPQPQGGYQRWDPQQQHDHQQQLRPPDQRQPYQGGYQQLPAPAGGPSAETQRATGNQGELPPSMTW